MITPRDIALTINIIDQSAKAGVFSGPDLHVVGTLRDKFVAVLKEAEETIQEDGDQAPPNTAAEVTVTDTDPAQAELDLGE